MSEKIVIMSTSIAKLATSLIAAKKEFSPILRDRNNPFFKSKYADLASALEATEPALEKNGLAVSQFPVNELDRIGVLTLILHESGEFIGREFTLPVAKQDAQTGTAAVTYARRTGYMAALGVAAEDDDGNSAAGNKEPETKHKAVEAQSAPKATKASTKAVAAPKADIPSELPGKSTAQPTGEPVTAKTETLAAGSSVANPAILNPVEGDTLPAEDQIQSLRNAFSLLSKDLDRAGLKASKGKPVGRKLTLYLLHRTGTKDPDKVTFGQWQKFLEECRTYNNGDGGYATLAKIVEGISGGK
jgi:hypothetical protein